MKCSCQNRHQSSYILCFHAELFYKEFYTGIKPRTPRTCTRGPTNWTDAYSKSRNSSQVTDISYLLSPLFNLVNVVKARFFALDGSRVKLSGVQIHQFGQLGSETGSKLFNVSEL